MHLLIYVKIFYAGNKTFCPTSRKNVHLTYWRNRTFDILIINLSQKTSPSGPREWCNVFRIFRPTQSPLCSAILRTMWLRVTLLVLLIPSAIFALFRYSPRATPSCPSLFTGALRGAEGGAGALVNPFIYLFMCHGGEHGPGEGVRDAAYSRRMHRTGNPTGAPAQDEGMAKVTGKRARILDFVSGARFSPSGIYRVFTYSCIFSVKMYKMRLLSLWEFKWDVRITFWIFFLFDRIRNVSLISRTFLYPYKKCMVFY